MTTQADSTLRQHMFALAPLRVWLRLLREHGGVAPRRRGALARILLTSLGTLPLRLAESAIHGRRVRRTPIATPPVMVLGYGRSGTTHLHNLLVCDPNHAGVTTYQAIAPACCLVGRRFLKPLIARHLPAKRPMDNMDVSLDLPQEEEIAIAGLSHQSFLHHLSFPRAAERCYHRYAAMQGLTPREIERWERTYLDVARKATVIAGRRRLVLKSPSNLARVPHILRLFPGAKFVHIVRNPYVVYRSLTHMFRRILPPNQLQEIAWEEFEEHILYAYERSMRQYLADRSRIAPGQLTEVRFEDLETRPLHELQRVYADLSLPNWERAKGHFTEYLGPRATYQKNRYRLDQAAIDRVDARWRFAVDTWSYAPPETG